MTRESWVQSQVESYQRLKKWYLMPLCLTLSIVRYGSKGKVEQSGERSSALPYTSVCYVLTFDPDPKNVIPRWCTGRKWHIPMASNRKRSRERIKAYNMGQGEGPTVPIQTDAPEESDLWTAWVISAWWRLNIRFQRSSGRSCGR